MKRVVKSSLAAEALSLVDGLDTPFCIGSLFEEIIYNECDATKIATQAFVNNKTLDSVYIPPHLYQRRDLGLTWQQFSSCW